MSDSPLKKNTRIMLVVGVGVDLEDMTSIGTVHCIWPGAWLCFQFKISLETTLTYLVVPIIVIKHGQSSCLSTRSVHFVANRACLLCPSQLGQVSNH